MSPRKGYDCGKECMVSFKSKEGRPVYRKISIIKNYAHLQCKKLICIVTIFFMLIFVLGGEWGQMLLLPF